MQLVCQSGKVASICCTVYAHILPVSVLKLKDIWPRVPIALTFTLMWVYMGWAQKLGHMYELHDPSSCWPHPPNTPLIMAGQNTGRVCVCVCVCVFGLTSTRTRELYARGQKDCRAESQLTYFA